jgi:hypothetical protein
MNLCEALLEDYFFSKKNNEYILEHGWFVKANINEKNDLICRAVFTGFKAYDKTNEILGTDCIFIDREGLNEVMLRYSRDIFGQQRLETQIESLTSDDLERRELIKNDLAQFGCRTSSSDPFFYRKIGYLFYWFSLIKPFRLDLSKVDIIKLDYNLKFYFNEFTAYALLKGVIDRYIEDGIKFKITIHEDPLLFRHFLYDLHFRDLSRSSLEFFLQKFIIPVSKDA